MTPASDFTYKHRHEILRIEDITRREFMFGALGAALLIACGDDDDEEAPDSGQREIQDAFGPVQVPANPERVIAVRHHHVGNMLALGFKPIGIVPDASEFPFPGHAELLEGVENVRAEADWMLDIEKALSLGPDLILEMSGQEDDPWNQEICDLAKDGAATVCFPYGYTYEEELKQNMLDVGLVLGMEDKAREIIGEYDARLAELRESASEINFADKPVANIVWQGSGNFFIPVDRPANMILRGLDIPQPEFQADPASLDEVPLSFENAEMLNEAYAIIVHLEGSTPEELEASPVWQLLEPVKNGRVLFVDANLWGWDYMPALMYMLDEVEQKLFPLLSA